MITAIGNPVYDYIKTQKIETDGRVLSGCSTNALLVLAKLNEPTTLIGSVGNDFKDKFIADLNKFGINHHITDSKETGGFSLIYYDDYGNRTLDLLGRANDITTLDPNLYQNSKAILIGPILGEVSFDMIKEIRKNYDGFYFCDPQGLIRNADENNRIFHEMVEPLKDTLRVFDVVKPNELEGKVMTGIDCRKDPYQAAKIIYEWGMKIVIVTLAELGSVIYDGREFIDIPPFETEKAVDATGCGDTYMAGFTYEYLKTKDLRKAGCFASCTSSIMIENTGPDFEMTEDMIRNRQEQLLAKTDYKVKVAVNR
ncbi:MAG: PfkB family carbohydrate kinase [candidate division Zixibacteria bacterium]|nr:PfkB family carbohydrate kinase [candidate division Zixibacteria bacterium]